MRIIFCGGGTAGHINPAIAVAQELSNQYADSEILFIGREGGKENRLIIDSGYKLKTIKIQGLKRKISIKNLKSLSYALRAKATAKRIIREFKPDVIFGTGGYVCWPVISAAHSLGIPCAIHESNISPGLTTRLVAKKCDLILLNHEKSKEYFNHPEKIRVVGNPLRMDFSTITRVSARKEMKLNPNEIMIVSFGGSIGAEKINETVMEVIKEYSTKEKNVRHIHATGARYYEAVKNSEYARGLNGCKILPYIDDMPRLLHSADIVISRCGAMTLSEISAVGVAAILIPSPNVSDNHQYKNAKYLSDMGGAILIEEKNLSKKVLISAICSLKSDENGRKKRAKIIKAQSIPNSAKLILKELISIQKGV